MPFIDQPNHFTDIIYVVHRSSVLLTEHSYHFTNYPCIYRSSVLFYRSFIPFCSRSQEGHVCMSWPVRLLSGICSQLCLLLPHWLIWPVPQKVLWGVMQDTAFCLYKDALTQAPVVDPSKPSILQPVACVTLCNVFLVQFYYYCMCLH